MFLRFHSLTRILDKGSLTLNIKVAIPPRSTASVSSFLFAQELLADTTFRPRINADAASRTAVSKLKVVSDPDNYIATVEVRSDYVPRLLRSRSLKIEEARAGVGCSWYARYYRRDEMLDRTPRTHTHFLQARHTRTHTHGFFFLLRVFSTAQPVQTEAEISRK